MALLNKATTPAEPAALDSPLVQSLLARELETKVRSAEARRDILRVDLAEARIAAEGPRQLRLMADAAWEAKAEDERTADDARRLEARRAADNATAQRVAEVERQLSAVDAEIAGILHNSTREHAASLIGQVWTPTVRNLVAPVRALLPALRAQRAAYDRIYAENCTGTIDRETELAIYGVGFSDELLPELERWLAAVERSGLADAKAK